MLVNIHGDVSENDNLSISINGETKTLDNINPVVSFNVEDKGKCEIKIEQQIITSKINVRNILVFILTIFIQGIGNILLMNTDSKWYNRINPYAIKADCMLDLQQDAEILLSYKKSDYNESAEKWDLPVIKSNPDIIQKITYESNLADYNNQYFNYAKRVVSVFSIVVLIFIILLRFAIISSNVMAMLFVSIVLTAIVLLVIVMLISQSKKKNKLLSNFKSNIV